jgi:hypothetical protein
VLYSFNYDLIDGANRRADYTALIDRIRLLDDVLHDEYSGWYISTETSIYMLQAYLAKTLRSEDRYTLEPVPKTIGASLAPSVVAWLNAHGVGVLSTVPAAAKLVDEFEIKLLRKRELNELVKANVARHFAARAARPKPAPPLLPLPLPYRAPAPVSGLGALTAAFAPPAPGLLTLAIMGSPLGRH